MRKLMLSLLLCLSTCVWAQRVDKPGASYDYICLVERGISSSGAVITDAPRRSYIHDKDGYAIKFESDGELLNFMTKRGWILVTSQRGEDRMMYIMKKNVTTDKNATQGLNLKYPLNEKK